MDKQKPLKDWTLGELQVYCGRVLSTDDKNDCQACALQKHIGCCPFDCAPCDWDLTDKPRFTEEEVADARAIRRIMYLIWDFVVRDMTGELALKNQAGNRMPIQYNLFPSILPGQSVRLSEIVGAKE